MSSTTAPAERPPRSWAQRLLVPLALLLAGASMALALALHAGWAGGRALQLALALLAAGALALAVLAGGAVQRLRRAARRQQLMAERLQRLSSFASDLAHDLRAPLHRLQMGAELALTQPRDAAAYRAVLESAVEDYERIARLIDNTLFLARAGSAQAATRPGWTDIGQRLLTLVDFFEPLAAERQLQLRTEVPAGLSVWADEMLLARAVGNLLSNALRHARSGSVVRLTAQPRGQGGVRVAVANEGEPIAPQHQHAIFERRYRAPGHDPSAGAGLGLAIVRSVMQLHGGSAGVHSAPGQPTVFTLDFPAPPRSATPAPR